MKNSQMPEHRCCFNTERLAIRSWNSPYSGAVSEQKFAETVIRILTPRVTRSLPYGWQGISTLSAASKWINERCGESRFLIVQLLSTNEIVGFIFLYGHPLPKKYYELRFGYLLTETIWGKGFGTELVKGLMEWCEKAGDIASVSGGVEPENIGSIKVLEKNGFTRLKTDQSTENVVFFKRTFIL